MSEYGNSNQRPDIPEITPAMIKKVIIGIIVILVLALGFSMFYTIEEQEQAAILTFGAYSMTEEEAGLHFKMPFPIQKVVKVPANLTQKIEIGFDEVNGQVIIDESEALMITGDENIVHADAIVEWRISDIPAFLYNIEDGKEFLRNAATASIRNVIGSTNLDYAITEGKTEIEALVTEELLQLQLDYNTGIHIIALRFQDIQPPSGEVEQAFKDVTNAREEQNTKINNARKYQNERIPVARGEAQALIEQAEATKEGRIFTAQGDVARFNAIYAEYQNNPAVTESRLIIETLEQILPNAQIFITSGDGDTVQYLPLNELMRNNSSQQGGDTQ
jgi:membrane protease subunit HflK